MKNDTIYLSSPHMCGLEQQYVNDAFSSNWIAPLGPHVNAFESELAAYVGVRAAAALSAGTAAVHLGLKLLGVRAGDTVFCSSLTFAASANPIAYEHATPVFIDSEPESWNMSPAALEAALRDADRENRLPQAVIIADLYGQSADIDALTELCDRYEVPILEDAAEALGATYKGSKSGGHGHLSVFSFNGNKIITTSGGGALVGNDVEAITKARFLATQARDTARHYEHTEIGYNYRMSNVCAAIGRGQMTVLDQRVEEKRRVFDRYARSIGSIPGITMMPESRDGRSTRWLSVATVNPRRSGITNIDIMDALAAENIEARPVWKPMHLQPVFSGCRYYPHSQDTDISASLYRDGICLPSGTNMNEDDMARVLTCIYRALDVRRPVRQMAAEVAALPQAV
jgi:pyridoxal phosphate-dependent aminotransferase EpsN